MDIHSPKFTDQQAIPMRYTGEGENVSPPLVIQGLPPGTQSVAIIVDDPDAPSGTFDHWLAWDIPPSGTMNLAEGASVPHQGKNGFNQVRYSGPLPPRGEQHRYYFKVYALDTLLGLPDGSNKKQLEDAMKGHTIAEASMVGTYKRQRT